MQKSQTQRSSAGTTRNVRKASEVLELRPVTAPRSNKSLLALLEIASGDADPAMEAAKRLISAEPDAFVTAFLSRIAADRHAKDWSRIAACYVLGFVPVGDNSSHPLALRVALGDAQSSVRVRSHAAEALGNLRDPGALSLLERSLFDPEESATVKKWCLYALGEINSRNARAAIKAFRQSSQNRTLTEETRFAGKQFEAERTVTT